MPDANGKKNPIVVEVGFEVGRPPGITAGAPLPSVFAATIQTNLEFGTYRWEMSIDKKIVDAAAFEVLEPPPGLMAQLQPPPAS